MQLRLAHQATKALRAVFIVLLVFIAYKLFTQRNQPTSLLTDS